MSKTKRTPYSAINIASVINHCLDANMHEEALGNPKIPTTIWGKHGIGKTDLVKAIAKSRNAKFVYIAPAQFEEMGDLLGMPDKQTNEDGEVVSVFRAPDWVPTEEGPGILLIDDVNRADDRILRGLMNLTQNYELSGAWKLPKGWDIIMTANPEGGDYSITEMDDAMLTRMRSFEMESDPEAWINWAKSAGIDKRGIEFIMAHPEAFQSIPPRAWTQFFASISIIQDLKKNQGLVNMLANSVLDNAMSVMFMKFVTEELLELPDIEDLLNNFPVVSKKVLELCDVNKADDTKRIDIINILTSRVTEYLKANTNTTKKVPVNQIKAIAEFMCLDMIPQDLILNMLIECQTIQSGLEELQDTNDDILQNIIFDKRLSAKLLAGEECVEKA